MRPTLQVVMMNLQAAAYQSTPGAPNKDYGPEGTGPMGQYLRPATKAEAEAGRPDFEHLSAELRERDPGTYTAWLADFEVWRAGDLSVRMPRVDAFEKHDENGLLHERPPRAPGPCTSTGTTATSPTRAMSPSHTSTTRSSNDGPIRQGPLARAALPQAG
ncbi:hypothetical protein [Streptomyces sp. NBC_00439]|uniref:hypothetical protein n=1 Tax=Streptomyces sp. NBC_00439 TaxID=2903650 RepID=UPI00224FE05E|nr:hypothetical protein [Streptomyces sp. NBC_00439]MCX5103476.1 hypothetical protein [Streptomyces sp. NBC_00439]